MRLAGSQRTGQSQEAALAEAVLALELPGTPPTCVVSLVTDAALEFLCAHLADVSRVNESGGEALPPFIPEKKGGT